MRRAVLVSRGRGGDWSEWRQVWVVNERQHTWRIWSWRNPFTHSVHKEALGVRVELNPVAASSTATTSEPSKGEE